MREKKHYTERDRINGLTMLFSEGASKWSYPDNFLQMVTPVIISREVGRCIHEILHDILHGEREEGEGEGGGSGKGVELVDMFGGIGTDIISMAQIMGPAYRYRVFELKETTYMHLVNNIHTFNMHRVIRWNVGSCITELGGEERGKGAKCYYIDPPWGPSYVSGMSDFRFEDVYVDGDTDVITLTDRILQLDECELVVVKSPKTSMSFERMCSERGFVLEHVMGFDFKNLKFLFIRPKKSVRA